MQQLVIPSPKEQGLWERGKQGPSICEMQNYYSGRFNNNHTCLEMGNILNMARCICAGVDSPRVL